VSPLVELMNEQVCRKGAQNYVFKNFNRLRSSGAGIPEIALCAENLKKLNILNVCNVKGSTELIVYLLCQCGELRQASFMLVLFLLKLEKARHSRTPFYIKIFLSKQYLPFVSTKDTTSPHLPLPLSLGGRSGEARMLSSDVLTICGVCRLFRVKRGWNGACSVAG
jgi:hypothetical protein